jgi:RNA polymerase sigma factor (sigma-70 family)
MHQTDIGRSNLLNPNQEQELAREISECRMGMINALGRFPPCSAALIEVYDKTQTDHLRLSDWIEGIHGDQNAPLIQHLNAADIDALAMERHNTGTSADPTSTHSETVRDGIDNQIHRLRKQLKRVMSAAPRSEHHRLSRAHLADEFRRLRLSPQMLWQLVRMVRSFAGRIDQLADDGVREGHAIALHRAIKRLDHSLPAKRPSSGRTHPEPPFQQWHWTARALKEADRFETECRLSIDDFGTTFVALVDQTVRYSRARNRLFAANLRLITHIARQFPMTLAEFADMTQEGAIGLLRAIERFDHRLGYRFSTYATFWIRLAISRALAKQQHIIHLPYREVARLSTINRISQRIRQHTGMEPTISDLADHLQTTEEIVMGTIAAREGTISFDHYDSDEMNTPSLYNLIEQTLFPSPFEAVCEQSLQDVLSQAIRSLDVREAQIVTAHFGIGRTRRQTLQQLGEEMKLTRERVRQIQVKALDRLRKRYGEVLVPFLDET